MPSTKISRPTPSLFSQAADLERRTYVMERFGLPVLRLLGNGVWPSLNCLELVSGAPVHVSSLFLGRWWNDVMDFLRRRKGSAHDVDLRNTTLILDMDFEGNINERSFVECLAEVEGLVGVFIRGRRARGS